MKNNKKLRFLLAGGYNTAFGYIVFVALKIALPNSVHYLTMLCLAFVISVVHAFFVQKYLVFRTKGYVILEFLRFVVVNLSSLIINALILSALVRFELNILLAQAISTIVTTLLCYLGHDKFSFKSQV